MCWSLLRQCLYHMAVAVCPWALVGWRRFVSMKDSTAIRTKPNNAKKHPESSAPPPAVQYSPCPRPMLPVPGSSCPPVLQPSSRRSHRLPAAQPCLPDPRPDGPGGGEPKAPHNTTKSTVWEFLSTEMVSTRLHPVRDWCDSKELISGWDDAAFMTTMLGREGLH